MNETRKKIINVTLIIMGVLGFAVLVLPWFNLSSSSYVRGYGSSSMDGGDMLGFSAAATSFFGYALYALPAAAIALALKVDEQTLPARAKALVLEFLGVAGCICLLLLMKEMQNYDSSISGSGYSASAGYAPIFGFWAAFAVYIGYGIIGLVMMFVAPKPDTQNTES